MTYIHLTSCYRNIMLELHNYKNHLFQALQDVKPNLSELAQQQDHASASNSYPVTVVVPPEMILRHSLGDHILDPGDKGDDENKDKDRMRDGKLKIMLNIEFS